MSSGSAVSFSSEHTNTMGWWLLGDQCSTLAHRAQKRGVKRAETVQLVLGVNTGTYNNHRSASKTNKACRMQSENNLYTTVEKSLNNDM